MKSATSALEKYSEKYATSERCENYMKLSKKRYEETLQRLEVRKCELRKEREDVILKFGEVSVLFFLFSLRTSWYVVIGRFSLYDVLPILKIYSNK